MYLLCENVFIRLSLPVFFIGDISFASDGMLAKGSTLPFQGVYALICMMHLKVSLYFRDLYC